MKCGFASFNFMTRPRLVTSVVEARRKCLLLRFLGHVFLAERFFLHDCAPCPLSRQCACGEEGRAWPPALPFHPLPLLLPPKGTQGLTRSRTASTVFGATKLLYLKASAVVSFCAGPEHAQGLLSAKLFSLMSFQLTWPFELEVLWPRQVLRSSQSDPSFGLPWTAHGPTPTVGVGRFLTFCSQD